MINDLFSYAYQYPHVAGHRHVPTSIMAAKKINRWVKSLDYKVLQRIKELNGATSGELADSLAINYKSAQPATSRLKKRGLIMASGTYRKSRHVEGEEIVWILCQNG